MNDSSTNTIVAQGLTKYRGEKAAVRNLSLEVPKGCIYGLIGPNGSGKTTVIKMLMGLMRPDKGSATIFGEASMQMSTACRQKIGYLSEAPFPHDLVFTDCLEFLSRFFDVWDWKWCKHLVDCLDVSGHKRLSEMSLGERRVAELLLAVAHKPKLIVLDDPALGLDAVVRREILMTLLETTREQGATVIFSSHILHDVERVVDHVGIIQKGKMKVSGSLEDIKMSTRKLIFPDGSAPESVRGEIARESLGRDVVVVTSDFSEDLVAGASNVIVEHMNLEDIFIATAQKRKEMRI